MKSNNYLRIREKENTGEIKQRGCFLDLEKL